MGMRKLTESGVQGLGDEIAAAVRSEMGPGASPAAVRDEAQVRVRAYLRSPEFRERQASGRREWLREESGDRALAVLDVLIPHDPARLIAAGAPAEQYATEAGPIAKRLRRARSREDAVRVVREVLDEYFGEDQQDVERLGTDVWEAWNEE